MAGNWSGPIVSGDNQLRIVTNQVTKTAGGGNWGGEYWNAATFGADTEAYVTIATVGVAGEAVEVMLRIQSPNSAGLDGYFLHVQKDASTDIFQLWEVLNNAQTQLGSTANQEFSSGDSVGIEAIGTTITGYYKASAGSWTSVLSATDSTTNTTGNIGVIVNGTTYRVDNFGGGTVVTAGGATAHLLSMMGVGA